MNTVYCVEDDADIRALIEYTLTSTGFNVESFENGKAFFKKIKSKEKDPQISPNHTKNLSKKTISFSAFSCGVSVCIP